MYRAVVSTKEVERITSLPEGLKHFNSLELLISPIYPYKKRDLKNRMEAIFNKAKAIIIPQNIDIERITDEMNDALL